jgi:hypothetical protein
VAHEGMSSNNMGTYGTYTFLASIIRGSGMMIREGNISKKLVIKKFLYNAVEMKKNHLIAVPL